MDWDDGDFRDLVSRDDWGMATHLTDFNDEDEEE